MSLEIGENESIKEAVRAGLGLSVVSRGSVDLELDTGRRVALNVAELPAPADRGRAML